MVKFITQLWLILTWKGFLFLLVIAFLIAYWFILGLRALNFGKNTKQKSDQELPPLVKVGAWCGGSFGVVWTFTKCMTVAGHVPAFPLLIPFLPTGLFLGGLVGGFIGFCVEKLMKSR